MKNQKFFKKVVLLLFLIVAILLIQQIFYKYIMRSPTGSCFVFRPGGPWSENATLKGDCNLLPMYVMNLSIGKYIILPTTYNFKDQITITGWINSKNLSRGVILFYQGNLSSTVLLVKIFDDKIEFNLNASGVWSKTLCNSKFKNNTWYFVATTWNGSTKKIFINGDLVCQENTQLSKIKAFGTPRIIGSDIFNYKSDGIVSNIQLYNTSLKDAEIKFLYFKGIGGTPILKNLVGWWPLNGDAKDYSGNNNHGTIYGGVSFVQNYNPP
ncbi:MAG: LamG domain-containing protein [Candidatus Micrarchaeia archaeon]